MYVDWGYLYSGLLFLQYWMQCAHWLGGWLGKAWALTCLELLFVNAMTSCIVNSDAPTPERM